MPRVTSCPKCGGTVFVDSTVCPHCNVNLAHRRAADEAAEAVASTIPGTTSHYRAWKHAVLTSPWETGAAGFVASGLTLGIGIALFFFWRWRAVPTVLMSILAFHVIARGVYSLEYGAPRPDHKD